MAQEAPDKHNPTSTSQHTDSTYSLGTVDSHTTNNTSSSNADPNAKPKKQRLKKFCVLPPKDAQGNTDPAWIQVFLEGVDEVAAHTTLFFMSETYERLVGDVGARIEEWLDEAESVRVAREIQGLD
jgi:hypothetical protein